MKSKRGKGRRDGEGDTAGVIGAPSIPPRHSPFQFVPSPVALHLSLCRGQPELPEQPSASDGWEWRINGQVPHFSPGTGRGEFCTASQRSPVGLNLSCPQQNLLNNHPLPLIYWPPSLPPLTCAPASASWIHLPSKLRAPHILVSELSS